MCERVGRKVWELDLISYSSISAHATLSLRYVGPTNYLPVRFTYFSCPELRRHPHTHLLKWSRSKCSLPLVITVELHLHAIIIVHAIKVALFWSLEVWLEIARAVRLCSHRRICSVPADVKSLIQKRKKKKKRKDKSEEEEEEADKIWLLESNAGALYNCRMNWISC